MITQEEINYNFAIGEERMEDVCSLIDNDMAGRAEIAGMLMGAMKAHVERGNKTLLESAIELAELINEGVEEDG